MAADVTKAEGEDDTQLLFGDDDEEDDTNTHTHTKNTNPLTSDTQTYTQEDDDDLFGDNELNKKYEDSEHSDSQSGVMKQYEHDSLEDEEEFDKQSIELNSARKRPLESSTLGALRLPPSIHISASEYNENKKTKTNAQQSVSMHWRYKRSSEDDSIIKTEDGVPLMESNAYWVTWEDHTTSLVVGDAVFDCHIQEDKIPSLLFEVSDDQYQVVHAPVSKRISVLATKKLTRMPSSLAPSNARTPRLTTAEETYEAEKSLQARQEALTELNFMARKQRQSFQLNKGLSAKDLEDSDNSD